MNEVPDWSKVDWGKPNFIIAGELGCPQVVVSYYRRLVGKPRSMTGVDWKSLDWDKNDQQLSEENRVSLNKVRLARELVGHAPKFSEPTVNGFSRSYRIITKEMISAVDWTMTRDIDLARQWHVSRERVRQIRQEGGHPVCFVNSQDTLSRAFERWMIDNRASIEGKLASAVSDECPIELPRERKYFLMKRSTIRFVFSAKRGGYKALILPINWDINNPILDAIWNRSSNWAAGSRMRFSKPKAKWFHVMRGTYGGGLQTTAEMVRATPDLQEAIRLEIEKALKIGITPRWGKLEMLGVKYESDVKV
jgi:hypothetical protein